MAHTGEPVKWTNPMGLPCVQPYKYMSVVKQVDTILQQLSLVDRYDD